MNRPVPIDDLVAESERLRRRLLAESQRLDAFAQMLIEETHKGADDDGEGSAGPGGPSPRTDRARDNLDQ